MTEKQAVETIKQINPAISDTQIKIMLNQAVKEFTILTEILRGQSTDTTQANKRYYPLTQFSGITSTEDIIKIDRVDLDDTEVNHLSGEPNKEDHSEAV